MIEYRIINCLGHLNIAKAIEDYQSKDPNWRVHTLVAADVEEAEVGAIGLEISMKVQIMRITRFVLLLEREIEGGSEIGPTPHLKL